jgi:lipopolysaccharide export system protein LptC
MTQAADQIRDERRHWAAPGGMHDKLVRFLAVALPGAIGVVAAVMILAPLSPRGEVSFLLDRNKVETVNERLRVLNAAYRGEDDKGRSFILTAGSAVQETARVPLVSMSGLVARIDLSEGPAELTTPDATYDYSAEVVRATGPINFVAADGYRLSTSAVAIDLNTRRVTGSGGVSGAVPAGTFSADRIVADLGERTVTLDGHARLRMEPGKLRMP